MSLRNRRGLQSARSLKRRRKKIIWVSALFLVAVGSIITALSLLSRANFLSFQDVEVNATTTSISSATIDDEIKTIAEKNLSGNWWHIFSKNNVLLYPKAAIKNDILAHFPNIQSVSIESVGMKELKISAIDHTPYGLACTESDNCFYIDSSGLVYAPAPTFSPGVYIRYYVTPSISDKSISDDKDIKNSSIAIGKALTDATHLATVKQVIDYMSAMKLETTRAVIADDGDYSVSIKNIYANATTTNQTNIYFNTSAPLSKTLEYFSKFWNSRTDKNFDYIDLRFGKDIVFKSNS